MRGAATFRNAIKIYFLVHSAQFIKGVDELAKFCSIIPHPNHLITLLAIEKFVEQSIINAVEPMETDGNDKRYEKVCFN